MKKGAKKYTFKCRFPACGKEFQTDNPYLRYCCPSHRQQHFLRKSSDIRCPVDRRVRRRGLHEDRFGEGRGQG